MFRRLSGGIAILAALSSLPVAAQEPDYRPPTVVIEKPTEGSLVVRRVQMDPGALFEPILIEGVAGDDVEMFAVTVHIVDAVNRTSVVAATCDGCGSRVARWEYRGHLAPGSYLVQAKGHDKSGNTGLSAQRRFYVI